MRCIAGMVATGCEEVVLEAEESNVAAIRLYEGLGFLRDKRLRRYYLNGSDAFRLKLLLPAGALALQPPSASERILATEDPATREVFEAVQNLQALSVEGEQ